MDMTSNKGPQGITKDTVVLCYSHYLLNCLDAQVSLILLNTLHSLFFEQETFKEVLINM